MGAICLMISVNHSGWGEYGWLWQRASILQQGENFGLSPTRYTALATRWTPKETLIKCTVIDLGANREMR